VPGSVLLTGAAGYLGQCLVASAPPGVSLHLVQHEAPPVAVPPGATVHTLDLADDRVVDALFARVGPQLVIHTAANMAPDRLESAIVRATENVCAGCAKSGAYLVHMSTDMVFDGEHAPYAEADQPSPISAYGRAKAAAEVSVLARLAGQSTIVRTSLITGASPLDPRSQWVAGSLQAGEPVSLFVDELRCPIWVEDLAAAVWELALAERSEPIVHIAGPEAISRYALGLLIANHAGLPAAGIRPALGRDQQPPRPRDLRLDTRLATGLLQRRIRPISEIFARAEG
jgi:dTDP-4-dehydrorhamnose reductase